MLNKPRKLTFVLIFIGLLLFTGCRSDSKTLGVTDSGDSDSTVTGGDGDTDTDSDTDSDSDTDTASSTEMDTETDTDSAFIDCPDWLHDVTVHTPPEGVEATPLSICSTGDEPVESNLAGRITLNTYSESPYLVTGQIEIPSDIQEQLTGEPTITVTSAFPLGFSELTVRDMTANDNGFSFNGTWPDQGVLAPTEYIEIQLTVSMQLQCSDAPGDTKTVESTTYLRYCLGPGKANWVSSGGTCTVCEFICEMAPSPIVPEEAEEIPALPRALNVEIVPVARGSRSLCLVAEPIGADGPVSYEWVPSCGSISDNTLGGVVWKLPKEGGLHQIQVVVRDRRSAGVASFCYRHSV